MSVSGGTGRPQPGNASRAVAGHAVAAPAQIIVPARKSTPYEKKIDVIKVWADTKPLRAIRSAAG